MEIDIDLSRVAEQSIKEQAEALARALPNIADMSDVEMVDELVAHQRKVIESMDRHNRIHQIIKFRTQDYMVSLMEEAHIHGGESSDGPEGFLSEGNGGQYL